MPCEEEGISSEYTPAKGATPLSETSGGYLPIVVFPIWSSQPGLPPVGRPPRPGLPPGRISGVGIGPLMFILSLKMGFTWYGTHV